MKSPHIVVYYLIIFVCDYCISQCNVTFQNVFSEVSLDGTTFLQEHINGKLQNRPIKKIFFKGFVPKLCPRTIRHMTELEEIALVEVGLVYLSRFYYDVPNLKYVRIRFNPINAIATDVFSFIKLNTLDLSYNMIIRLGKLAFHKIDVDVLDLSHNRLKNIRANIFDLAKISELRLDNNKIMQLEGGAFQSIHNIEKLYLNQNNINYIEDYTFRNLGPIGLSLSGNDLTSINFLKETTLEHLDISFNKISYLSVDNSTSIESMEICPNPWHCQCLKNFWKYAEKHDINIIDAVSYDLKPICVATSVECLDNYNYDKVRDLYFKEFNYFDPWDPYE